MNPWLKSALFGMILAGICFCVSLIPFDRQHDVGQYEIPATAAKVCVGSLLLSLIAGWLWQRFVDKQNGGVVPILVVVVSSIALFSISTRTILGEWFWHRWIWLAIFPIIMCGLPTVYLFVATRRFGAHSSSNDA